MEPRARASKNVGRMNFDTKDLGALLYAHGDSHAPLPETIRVLDEIVTEFVQGLAFEAARAAHHAGRQKIKFEDFQFAFRKDPRYLGKVQEVFEKKVEIESARKTFNQEDEDLVAAAFAAAAAANGTEMDVDTVAEGASGGGPRKSTAAGPATSGSAADPGLAVPMPLSRSGGADGSQQAVDDEELGEADDDAAAEEDALGSRVR